MIRMLISGSRYHTNKKLISDAIEHHLGDAYIEDVIII